MSKNYLKFSRRQFFAATAGLFVPQASAQEAEFPVHKLVLFERELQIGGQNLLGFGVQGAENTDFFRGGRFRVEVLNGLSEPASLHWHGLLAPFGQDGASPPQQPLAPGERKVYDFTLTQSGTHMMSAGFGLAQAKLLAAPLIVRDINQLTIGEMESTVLFQDVQFGDADDIIGEIKGESGGSTIISNFGLSQKAERRIDDAGILQQDAYLANGHGIDDPEVITVPDGTNVRLRLINACSASHLQVDFSGLEAVLIGLDGWPISGLAVRELPLACGQRADVRVRLPKRGAFGVLGKVEGRAAAAGVILRSQGVIPESLQVNGITPAITEFALEGKPFGIDVPAQKPIDVKATLDFGGGIGKGFNINGNSDANGILLEVRQGQRVELLLRNQTGISQAMHLHGHAFQVNGLPWARFAGPMRDCLLIPADGQIALQFDANNPGLWPFVSSDIYRRASGLCGLIKYNN